MNGRCETRAMGCLAWMLAAGLVVAQPAPDTKEADAAYQAEEWAGAAAGYEKIVAAEPSNARAWYRLGVSRREIGEHAAAVEAFGHAQSGGVPSSFVDYEIAKVRALQGDEDAAYAKLESAVAGGFANYQGLEADEDLAGLRGGDTFAALVDRAKRNAMPCEYDPKHREFDFWIGEWAVADANGTPQGHNSITKDQNGCVLIERWTSAGGGGGGMSMNFYDPGKQQWVQQWVSANGGFINIAGGMEDGSMVLVGTINGPGQTTDQPFRGTWTLLDDGRMRQFFEQSSDGGKTWAPWFEGFYSRKSAGQ
ncbi:MAG: tetratricopeptide repeat protein [Gammaproteobacteria bacterium]